MNITTVFAGARLPVARRVAPMLVVLGLGAFGGMVMPAQAQLADLLNETALPEITRAATEHSLLKIAHRAEGRVESPARVAFTVWGSGDYRVIGTRDSALEWESELATGHLGVDLRSGRGDLLGLLVSHSNNDMDYVRGDDTGEHTFEVTTVHPYLGWQSSGGQVDGWIAYGRGDGEVTYTATGETAATSEVEMQSFGVGLGVNGQYGNARLRLKGDFARTTLEIIGDDDRIVARDLDDQRARLGIEYSHRTAAGRLVPRVEFGLRHDAGSGLEGTSMELGTGLAYHNTTRSFGVRADVHVVAGRNDYDEWGLTTSAQFAPGRVQYAVSFSTAPLQTVYPADTGGEQAVRIQGRIGF